MATRFDAALTALRKVQRDAEKEATRLELTQPDLAQEARVRADGLADARRLLEASAEVAKVIATLQ